MSPASMVVGKGGWRSLGGGKARSDAGERRAGHSRDLVLVPTVLRFLLSSSQSCSMMKLGVSVVAAAAAAAAGFATTLLLWRKQSPSPKPVHADRRVGFSLLLPLPAQDHFDDHTKLNRGMVMHATKLNRVEDQGLVREKEIRSLKLEKENLIVERSSLISQVDNMNQKLARVENTHAQLEIKYLNLKKENALRVHQVSELESLLKLENLSLEDSQEENSQLLAVIDNLKIQMKAQTSSLISQVDNMNQKLARVENTHAQLEIKYLNLEKENALRVHQVLELESLLKLENLSLEDSQEENSQLLAVIDNLKIQIQTSSLISQVDCMSQKLSRVENRHAELEINHLNLEKENEEKLDHLERENRGLRAYLDAYLPLVTSLQGSVISLEEQTLSLIRHPASINQESEEIFLGSYQKLDNNLLGEHQKVPNGVLELQKMIAKFGELQKVITDTAALLAKERLDHNADLEAAKKEISEIKAQKRNLISQVNSMRQKFARLENIHVELVIDHLNLEKENALRVQVMPLLGEKVRDSQEENSQLLAVIDNLKIQITSESERAHEAEIEVQSLKDQVRDSGEENSQLLAVIDNLKIQITSESGRAHEVETEVRSRKAQKSTLISQVNTTRQKFARLENRYAELVIDHLNLEKENALRVQVTPLLGEKVRDSQEEKFQLLAVIDNYKIQITSESERAYRAETEVRSLKDQVRDSREENSHLSAAIDNLKIQITSEFGRAHEAETGVQSLKAQKNTLISQVNSMRQKFARLENRYAELVIDHLNLEKENALRVQVISLLGEKVRDSPEENSQLLAVIDNLKIQITSESERAYRAETEVQSLKDRVRDSREENSQLSAVIDNLNIQISSESGCAHEAETEVQSLKDTLSNLNSEKEYCLYQSQQSLEKISYLETQICQEEESTFLEKSSSVVKPEIEGLRRKWLKDIEDSLQALYDQKENLIVERSILISQVDSMRQELARVGNRHTELEIRHLNLKKENSLRAHIIIPLFLRQVDSMSLKLARVVNALTAHVIPLFLELESLLKLENAKDLKEKLDNLEGENRGLRAYLDVYLHLVMLLQGSIASLEEPTLSLIRHPASFFQESEENFLASHQKLDNNFLGEHPTPLVPTGVLELQKLIAKFGELQKVITDTAALLAKDRLDHNADLEAARKEIQEIKAQRSSSCEEIRTENHKLHQDDCEDSTGVLELQKLIAKFGELKKVITDTPALLAKERLDHNVDLEAARKEIREIKAKGSSSHEEIRMENHKLHQDNVKTQKGNMCK